VIGARTEDHHIVELPTWLSALVGFDLSWKMTDAWPEFDPVWLLRRGVSGRYEASLLHEIKPDVAGDAAGSQWGRLIAVATLCDWENEAVKDLWERYRRAAGVEP
jgi:hypothetical protein